MSRTCDILAEKRYQSGNNVSHSNRKTRRRFQVNVQTVTLQSQLLNRDFVFTVAASTLRSINKNGGLDTFLLKTGSRKLTEEAHKLRRMLQAAAAEQKAA